MGLAVTLVGAAATIGALAGDTERIGNYWMLAQLDDAGGARVVEMIDYDFGPRSRRGILRDIPDVDPTSRFVVTSPTAPDRFEAVGLLRGGTRLRVGDPSITITNRHRYHIEYSIDTLVQGERISWNAVGLDWTVPINNAEIHLTTPYRLNELTCDRGTLGEQGGCNVTEVAPGHLLVEVSGLDAGEGVTVSATRGSRLESAPEPPLAPTGPATDPGSGWLMPGVAALGAALLAAGVTSPWIRKLGKEQVWEGGAADAAFGPPAGTIAGVASLDYAELAQMATIEFESPRDLSAAAGGIIHAEQVKTQHQLAWLIESAIRSEIVLNETDGDLEIVRGEVDVHPAVAPTLDTMFAGRERVELGKYDKDFATGWKDLGGELEEWRQASGLWAPAGRKRKTAARVWGTLASITGLGLAVLGGVIANRAGTAWIALAVVGGVLAGAGMTAVIRSWELPIRTPQGSARWLQIESFRRFIAASEARHAQDAARLGLLRHYTAWAVALGELDHWTKAVESAADIPGSAVDATPDLRFVALAPTLSGATRQTFTAPSSSGSGGGGGAGGGGGGGGGGSW